MCKRCRLGLGPADRRCLDVRRRLHGGRRLPASHSDDGQLSAVSPPQALALRAALHEPVQRGNVRSNRQTRYVTARHRGGAANLLILVFRPN